MAQLSIKLFFYQIGILFEGFLCWFAYVLVRFSDGFEIDFDYREHKTIIFCTIVVFAGRIILMCVDLEKKQIEIKQKKVDLAIKEEELRSKRIENDIKEKNAKI